MARTKAAPAPETALVHETTDTVSANKEPVSSGGVTIESTTDVVMDQGNKATVSTEGSDVVHAYSRLTFPRVFLLSRENGDEVTIPSYTMPGKDIVLEDSKSVFFSLKRSVWNELIELYGDTDAFRNGIIAPCDKETFSRPSFQDEINALPTGYESISKEELSGTEPDEMEKQRPGRQAL